MHTHGFAMVPTNGGPASELKMNMRTTSLSVIYNSTWYGVGEAAMTVGIVIVILML